MTTSTKGLLAFAVIAGIFGLAAFFGLTPFGRTIVKETFGTTTQGGTGTTARQFNVYGVNLAAPGANATSSSILNNSGNDIYVSAIKVGCEGVGTSKTAYTGGGLASLQLSVGTTSTANPASAPGNLVGSAAVVIGTSTAFFVEASSTAVSTVPNVGSASVNNIWPNGSYMSFTTNATNTAICTFGVEGFSS